MEIDTPQQEKFRSKSEEFWRFKLLEAASSGKGGGRLGEGGRLTGKVVSMSLGGHKFEGCI